MYFDWDTAQITLHPSEERWIAIGFLKLALCFVVYAERGDHLRLISLRKATRKEVTTMPKNNSPLPSKSELRALADGPLSFDAIEAQYDEETAIQVGILRDPNTHELTAEEAARLSGTAAWETEGAGEGAGERAP